MKVTISAIKADVGSVGGHTNPTPEMLASVNRVMSEAKKEGQIIDYGVFFTGDDICIISSHTHGINGPIHQTTWRAFEEAAKIAHNEGNYGAGQDLVANANTSGNIRGAGPGVAEIEFELLPKHRGAESFMVLAADKCGPGAYNFPLYMSFANVMSNSGNILNPALRKGCIVTIADMNAKTDRVIRLELPRQTNEMAALLRDANRYGVSAIQSIAYPDEQLVSVSTSRLHNIAGKYVGKDDPVAIIRNQGISAAPEELVEPWRTCHLVTGGARGSHIMPIMPVGINTAVTGFYCLPVVSCLGFSMNGKGEFTQNYADFFGGSAWDATRLKAQSIAEYIRSQGVFTMAENEEIAYTGLQEMLNELNEQFVEL